jgi:hypothetical protein
MVTAFVTYWSGALISFLIVAQTVPSSELLLSGLGATKSIPYHHQKYFVYSWFFALPGKANRILADLPRSPSAGLLSGLSLYF